MKAQAFTDLQPRIVLGVAAHPDDLDYVAAGTIAKFAADGAKVYYLVLTDGSVGSADRSMTPAKLKQLRRREQRQAAAVLGVSDVFFGDYCDGTLENCLDVKRDIVRMIRRLRPDTVITFDPSMLYSARHNFVNHPDHRAAGQAALDAVFPLARDHLCFPELLAEGYEPHKTGTILLVNLESTNYCVDIGATLPLKFAALAKHTSQFPSPTDIKHRLTEQAEQLGEAAGCRHAEAFMRIDIR